MFLHIINVNNSSYFYYWSWTRIMYELRCKNNGEFRSNLDEPGVTGLATYTIFVGDVHTTLTHTE